ncbi:MAG: hypothetical protein K9I29_07350 [Bacteroidales bacterium]|nr:hypothetical protein [Bacteroidales bacterium]MCF8328097.1 hypothetical protein [Bacteroidales bacterium]
MRLSFRNPPAGGEPKDVSRINPDEVRNRESKEQRNDNIMTTNPINLINSITANNPV